MSNSSIHLDMRISGSPVILARFDRASGLNSSGANSTDGKVLVLEDGVIHSSLMYSWLNASVLLSKNREENILIDLCSPGALIASWEICGASPLTFVIARVSTAEVLPLFRLELDYASLEQTYPVKGGSAHHL
ncbi:hypothetical protein H7U22_07675 [Pedobacter sp. CCM 8938]|uniref:Uncharacterized protein n=1 Tax=Pedobacter fastidiosus TaxID=2765361 RepID=A0ABR7KR19_9SPHI|nr:hypothetical protein [Pedobacter fastidiosus]